MAGLPDLANRFLEPYTSPSTLEEAIQSLDVYHGVPNPDSIQSTRLNASFLPELRSYLRHLQDAESIVAAAIDDPEGVFQGIHQDPLVKDKLTKHESNRKVAPPVSYKVQILDMETEFFSACYGHLQQIAKRQWELSLARREAKGNGQKEYSTTTNISVIGSSFTFSPLWYLHASEHFLNGQHTRAYLVPTEQPEYSQRWVSNKLSELQPHVLPDVISQEVQHRVATNFCFSDGTSLRKVSAIDHGDKEGIESLLTTTGWQIEPESTSPAYKYFYIPDAPSVPRLSIRTARNDMLDIEVYFSPELRTQIREDLFERLRQAAYMGIDSLLEQARSQPPDTIFELSPRALVRHVIYDLNPDLPDWDYRNELDNLCVVVMPILIEKLWNHSTLAFVAHTLTNLMNNSRAKNVLGSIQGKASLGWHPEEVIFELPVSLLHQDN